MDDLEQSDPLSYEGLMEAIKILRESHKDKKFYECTCNQCGFININIAFCYMCGSFDLEYVEWKPERAKGIANEKKNMDGSETRTGD